MSKFKRGTVKDGCKQTPVKNVYGDEKNNHQENQ